MNLKRDIQHEITIIDAIIDSTTQPHKPEVIQSIQLLREEQDILRTELTLKAKS